VEKMYQQMWELAKQYYQEGRPSDIIHIEWMLEKAEELVDKVGADRKILFPLIIFHDIGYSVIDDITKITRDQTKEIHMREGAKIADKILKKVKYDPKLAKEIVRLVSIHDNWYYGEHEMFRQDKNLALFNDLDFISAIFDTWRAKWIMKKENVTKKEMYNFWTSHKKGQERPLCCKETKELYEEALREV